jgi:hypothetical protein
LNNRDDRIVQAVLDRMFLLSIVKNRVHPVYGFGIKPMEFRFGAAGAMSCRRASKTTLDISS